MCFSCYLQMKTVFKSKIQIWSLIKFRCVDCWSNDRKFHPRKTNLTLSVDTKLRENYCNIVAEFILKDYI